jgi:hypothetical protein
MNNNANIKQLKLIKFLNENCNDDHVISRISIVLRRDKLEAPYYMNTKIRLSSCLDNGEKGLIHAMNILNHSRMYNLTEDKYNEIRSMIIDTFEENKSEQVEFSKNDKQIKIALLTKNDEEFKNLYENYHELFEKIDNLID